MSGVTVALVGIGGYGEAYVRALLGGAARHGAVFAAAVDPTPERCSLRGEIAAAGVPFFRELDQMYARLTPDLVVLCTPIPLHAPQATRCLAAGSNVLCEKPAAATVRDAMAMRAAERRAGGRFLAIGFQWSFSAAVRTLKSDIRSGALGRPLRMKTMALWPRDSAYYQRNGWAGRIRDDSGAWVFDSPLSNATSHYLHNMFYLLGRDESSAAAPVSVASELYRANPIENFDTAALRIATDVGAELLFLTTHACRIRMGPVSVFEFEEGVVTYAWSLGNALRARLRDGSTRDYGQPDEKPDRKLWTCVDAARTGGAVPCGVEASLPHLLCVHAAQEAADTIGQVSAPDAGEQSTGSGATLRWINGIDDLFVTCFGSWLLPSELGHVPWAVPARKSGAVDCQRAAAATPGGGAS